MAQEQTIVWHKIADGNLPKESCNVLAAYDVDDSDSATGRCRVVHEVYFDKNSNEFNRVFNTPLDDVIAWAVLPKYGTEQLLGNESTIEDILKDLGFLFYDDDSFDYWTKDGILFYEVDSEWYARLSKAFMSNPYMTCEASDIKTKEDVLEAIEYFEKMKSEMK